MNLSYYELTKAGRIHHYTTPDEGLAPGTDVAGTAAVIVVRNVPGSKYDLAVVEARLVYESGTLGAGPVYWVRAPNSTDAIPTGTDMLYTPGYLDGAARPAFISALYTVTIAATDPIIWRMFGGLASQSAANTSAPSVLMDRVDGQLVVAPGWWVGIMGDAAAGTTPLVGLSLTVATMPMKGERNG